MSDLQPSELPVIKQTVESGNHPVVAPPAPTPTPTMPPSSMPVVPISQTIPSMETIAENARYSDKGSHIADSSSYFCRSLQDRLTAAAAAKRQQQLSAQPTTKKMRNEEPDNSAASAYLKQKSELESLSGGAGDDGGKWYVR
jgi:hypothetical protein